MKLLTYQVVRQKPLDAKTECCPLKINVASQLLFNVLENEVMPVIKHAIQSNDRHLQNGHVQKQESSCCYPMVVTKLHKPRISGANVLLQVAIDKDEN